MLELRNACAHGDVLYDFNLPMGLPNFSVFGFIGSDRQSIFACYKVLSYLIKSISVNRQNPTANWLINALDEMTSMKILSRIEGDETKTGDVIEKLLKILNTNYPKSNLKLNEMKNKLQFGYTSFWS